MGNYPRNKSASKKAQPAQYLPSGEESIINSGTGAATKDMVKLRISLVQLVPSVLPKISVNDPVAIIFESDSYYCHFLGEQLGRIPANYNRQLLPGSFYRAIIYQCSETPAVVVVELDL